MAPVKPHGTPASGSKRSDVGYRRPPKEHRFPKGISGNPRGRPKKRQTVGEKFARALDQIVPVRGHNGEEVQMTMLEAIIRNMVAKAAKGDLRAADLVIRLSEC